MTESTLAAGNPADDAVHRDVNLIREYQRTGDSDLIRRAVKHLQRALADTAEDDYRRAIYLSNLGNALFIRFKFSGDPIHLENAVDYGKQALVACSSDDSQRTIYWSNLAAILFARFGMSGGTADLDCAVEYGQRAVSGSTDNDPNRFIYLSNLSQALMALAERMSEPDDPTQTGRAMAEEALTLINQALESNPDNIHSLLLQASALRGLGRYEDAESSLRHILGSHPNDVRALAELAEVLRLTGREVEASAITDRSGTSFGKADLVGDSGLLAFAVVEPTEGDIRRRLEEILLYLLDHDSNIREMRRTEVVSVTQVMDQAHNIVDEDPSDLISQLRDIGRVEQARRNLLAEPDPWYVNAAFILGAIGGFGLIVLLVIGIIKLTGHLLSWPLWPFVAIPLVLFFGGFIVGAIFSSGGNAIESTRAALESVRASFDDTLRMNVIIPAIERATLLSFAAPEHDIVYLTDAPGLASRIESGNLIETRSRRDVVTNLGREGGATIGLAGSRGVGKSELLRAFCANDLSSRIIGINIPAPVAYQAQPFLQVLIRRLAEAVPGYNARMVGRPGWRSPVWVVATLVFAAIILIAGLVFISSPTTISRHEVGWGLIIAAGIIIVLCVGAAGLMIVLWASRLFSLSSFDTSALTANMLTWIWVLTEVTFPFRASDISEARKLYELRIDRIRKLMAARALAVKATDIARRVRYVETRSASSESSASWKNAGFKRTLGLSLGQVPLTEPDLVVELTDLVGALSKSNYKVRIGIDELDKLVQGDDAEKFLTDIKALFPIRECSFLLTISENAFSQFARRGLPIRDVFDSSLDAVIVVRPFTFGEARRLMRARLSSWNTEKISDSQVLLCYCLAGGLPRDCLRFCRQLGEVNSEIGPDKSLDKVMAILLRSEIRSRIDGVRFALQTREEGEAASIFMSQLELMERAELGDEAAFDTKAVDLLEQFLSQDEGFATLCRSASTTDVWEHTSLAKDKDWIRDTRRQLLSYLYFAETVNCGLGLAPKMGEGGSGGTGIVLDAYEILADARRRMEMDAAAGWRRTSDARRALGLAAIPAMHDRPAPVRGGVVGYVSRSLRSARLAVAAPKDAHN